MKPHEYIKSFGFLSIKQVSELIQKPSNTIVNWYSKEKRMLELILKGLLSEKEELLRIIEINQFTSFEGEELISVHFEGGLTLYKKYPPQCIGETKTNHLQRKLFFHNFCVMYHKSSALNAAQLENIEEQIKKNEK